ncbi:hypothetical protein F5884DRAFT_854519 [Xylogone sp. PMI_703]|nr:hypothetical protein F5884DRAFT_854519 [Xylogone sp. PMI_703]
MSAGSDLYETVRAYGNNIGESSELIIHIAYGSLVDLTLQLFRESYPDNISDFYHTWLNAAQGFPVDMAHHLQQLAAAICRIDDSGFSRTVTDALKWTSLVFDRANNIHKQFADELGQYHERISMQLQSMNAVTERAEESEKYLIGATEMQELDIDSSRQDMDAEKRETARLENELHALLGEIEGLVNEQRRQSQPQDFWEGFAWSFGKGIESAINIASLGKSIETKRAEAKQLRALMETHQTRLSTAASRLEKAVFTMKHVVGLTRATKQNLQDLRAMADRVTEAMKFVIERKDALSRLRNTLHQMKPLNQAGSSRLSPETQRTRLARNIQTIVENTPDWRGTTIPVTIITMLLHWDTFMVKRDSDDVGDSYTKRKITKRFLDYVHSHQGGRPSLSGYLTNLEGNWAKNYGRWRQMVTEPNPSKHITHPGEAAFSSFSIRT